MTQASEQATSITYFPASMGLIKLVGQIGISPSFGTATSAHGQHEWLGCAAVLTPSEGVPQFSLAIQ